MARFSYSNFITLMVFITLTGCANRGFYLTQQIPGLDNNLNPVEISSYRVESDGSIKAVGEKKELQVEKRKLATMQDLQNDNLQNLIVIQSKNIFVESTMDTEHGAMLLNSAGN